VHTLTDPASAVTYQRAFMVIKYVVVLGFHFRTRSMLPSQLANQLYG